MIREASVHLNLYLEAQPEETNEEVMERLEWFIRLLPDIYKGLSHQIYDIEINEF